MDSPYFFCFGYEKSGTTFLQLILDEHPELACPNEVSLSFFFDSFPKVFKDFNTQIFEFNEVKGLPNEKIFLLDKSFIKNFTKEAVFKILNEYKKDKNVRLVGVKDNEFLPFFSERFRIFNQEKFIFIVRDPRSIAISLYHHNLRLYANEGQDYSKKTTIDKTLFSVMERFNTEVSLVLEYLDSLSGERILVIKYEDLLVDFEKITGQIFDFLKVKNNKELTKEIKENTKFSKFQDGKFFRKGSTDEWHKILKPETQQKVIDYGGEILKYFGYTTEIKN